MTINNKIILILAAHPDDEILGCGGVIQKLVADNNTVFVGIITDGSSSQYPDDKVKSKKKIEECVKANMTLGVSRVEFLNLPDMKLDTIPHIELNKKIENLIEKIKPAVIYTHSESDLNNDHVAVAKSTYVACRPGKPYLEKIFAYEVLSSSEWSRGKSFTPEVFINIEKYLKKKIKAFNMYKTEVRPYPHPRSAEGITILAQYRGLQSGFKAAEAFKLIISYEK